MVLSWTRTKRIFRRANKGKELPGLALDVEIAIPPHFLCPVTLDLMRDPVTLSTGITYDRDSIEKWIEAGNITCPVTNQVLSSFDMIPNHAIRKMIQDWCVEHHSYGFERIPTPRIPVTAHQVSETLSGIVHATQRRDEVKCQELVNKIKIWCRESERNKKCILDNGSGAVLADAFDTFSGGLIEKNTDILEEILRIFTWIFPLKENERSRLGSESSLRCMICFLNGKDLETRQNAALLLKELPVESLARTEGLVEALVRMVRDPVGPTSTKACLKTIIHLISSLENKEHKITTRFVELGLVSLVLEAIVDAERGICEKALAVLDCLCDCTEGKQMAKRNVLSLPLAVKKILRVSDLASDLAVSVLWKLCFCEKSDEGFLIEAVEVGAFQKLLVLLQVGCGESTKGRATELLKLLNGFRNRAECVDSSLDLKYLKKPF